MKTLIHIVFSSILLGSSAYFLNYYIFSEPNIVDESLLTLERKKEGLCLNADGLSGDILTQKKMSWCALPDHADSKLYLVKDTTAIANLENIVLREFVAKGKFLKKSLYLHPHEQGYLSLLLGENTRAKSVPINNIDDYLTVLHRGDHVDLLFAYMKSVSGKQTGEVIVKTLLKNVRVLGIKGDYGQGVYEALSNIETMNGQLTLALTSREAELATVAEQIGTLSIVLRSSEDIVGDSKSFPTGEGVQETDLIGFRSISENNNSGNQPRKIRILRGGKITFIDRPGTSNSFQSAGLK
ncbi:MAG: Flp pilus assembly protein CpaB [Sneathiella sp.]